MSEREIEWGSMGLYLKYYLLLLKRSVKFTILNAKPAKFTAKPSMMNLKPKVMNA